MRACVRACVLAEQVYVHTESLDDLERQSPLGHPKETTEADSIACTGAGEAGKEVSQLSSPLQVSIEDETCVNTRVAGRIHAAK